MMAEVDENVVAQFCSLFHGRLDVFGTEEGGCAKSDDPSWENYVLEMTSHLYGLHAIGTYPMVEMDGEWFVRWGCVDFDEGDEPSYIHAMNLHTILSHFGIAAWLEKSRSKGWHCWIFADDWVPAATMRRALLGATETAKGPIKEINPKQETMSSGQVGNYVRLPYPHGWESNLRRCVIDPNTSEVLPPMIFADVAVETRCSLEMIEEVMALWKPPAKPKPRPMPYVEGMRDAGRIGPLSKHILRNGPKEGNDRSSTLWSLANSLYRDGVSYQEALDVVYEADRRWGKFLERNDAKYLDEMCKKLWG